MVVMMADVAQDESAFRGGGEVLETFERRSVFGCPPRIEVAAVTCLQDAIASSRD